MSKKILCAAVLLGSGSLLSLPTLAAPEDADAESRVGLEEVVVTAQRREESLQETPISIVQFGSQALENLGFNNLADIQSNVPNLTVRQSNVSGAGLRLYIRGIGTNDVQISQDPSVGLYVDGIYISRSSGAAFQIADVERIEVLRGPQGSLYGRNTTGGAINVINKKPSGTFGIKQTFSVGNFSHFESLTQVDLPRVADVAVKLSFLKLDQDGFVENKGAGRDFGDRQSRAARAAVNWSPSDTFSADYAFDWTRDHYAAPYYQTVNPPKPGWAAVPYSSQRLESVSPRNYIPGSKLDIDGHSLTLQWQLSDELTLRSLTGYRDMQDDTYQEFGANAVTPRLFSNGPMTTESRQFSQELQLLGSLMDKTLEFIGGVYYFDEKSTEDQVQFVSLLTPAITERLLLDTRGKAHNSANAVYGQVDWKLPVLDHKLKLSVGGRYSQDRRSMELNRVAALNNALFDVTARDKWSDFSPSFTLAYAVSDDINAYVKYVKGYKTGGFNGRAASIKAATTPVNAEIVKTTEVGIKAQILDNKLRLNAAAFSSDYDDIQLFLVDSPGVTVAFNAGKAKIQGFEFNATAAPLRDLQLSLSYGYTDAKIERVSDPATGANIASGFTLPSAPKHTVDATVDYTFPRLDFGTVTASVNYSWRDRFRFAVNNLGTPGEWSEPYGLLQARVTLDEIKLSGRGDLKLAVWGKNLTDKQYFVDLIPTFSWSSLVGAYGEPRSYGVDLSYRFE